jgi:hypothetical protein
VASGSKLVLDQMAVPVPEIMDGSLYNLSVMNLKQKDKTHNTKLNLTSCSTKHNQHTYLNNNCHFNIMQHNTQRFHSINCLSLLT